MILFDSNEQEGIRLVFFKGMIVFSHLQRQLCLKKKLTECPLLHLNQKGSKYKKVRRFCREVYV